MVLVKHLAHAGLDPENAFEMLLVTQSEAWHIRSAWSLRMSPGIGSCHLPQLPVLRV